MSITALKPSRKAASVVTGAGSGIGKSFAYEIASTPQREYTLYRIATYIAVKEPEEAVRIIEQLQKESFPANRYRRGGRLF